MNNEGNPKSLTVIKYFGADLCTCWSMCGTAFMIGTVSAYTEPYYEELQKLMKLSSMNLSASSRSS